MASNSYNLPPPVEHVFLDYENVHVVDPTIFDGKTVHLTLLVGAHKTKFDSAVVEKLWGNAASVEFIRLKSSGKNALDFALAYYIGRAVGAAPVGHFHIISRDKGYDPLVEHLCSKHIRIQRHVDFSSLPFSSTPKSEASASHHTKTTVSARPKSALKPKATPPHPTIEEELEKRVLEHLRKPATPKPKTKMKLLSFLEAFLGHKTAENELLNLIENLGQAGHLYIDDRDKVTYHLSH